ncbi:hypothetical protein GGI17_002204 [Coemansia sp. S146]|nr:hypothetical protein GGI17_002204 [Coemansia sp. S146]
MEFEKHYNEKRCKTECKCCNDDEPFKRSTTDDKRFRWNRIRHWLEFAKVPYDVLLKKDEEAEPGRRYFNTMLSMDEFGASLSTFKWVGRKLSEQTPETSTAPPDPSATEFSTVASSSSFAAPTTSTPLSSMPPNSAPPTAQLSIASGKRGRTPEPAQQPNRLYQLLSSSVGVKRKHTPRSVSTAEGEPVVPRVIARARVRRLGPEPPPPAYLRAMAELAADPYNGLLPASASDEAADAMLVAVADDLGECTAALSELRAVCLASHAESETAAHWAASIDHGEYYTEHKRTAIYNEKCEAVTIAYDTAIRVAETAAGPELERTEAQAADLEVARDAAMKTALRGVDVARFVASEVIYAEKRKAAAALDALRQPNHVRIGGDPGVKTTTTSAETLVLLQYLFKTANFVTHMEMHQKLRVREVRWKVCEQKASTIAEYCRRITVGRKREETAISIGDAKIKNMRSCMPCPRVKKLIDQLRRTGWHAIMVKETNTSQVCSSCMMRLSEGQAPVKLCDVGSDHDTHRFKAKPGNKHFVRRCTVCLKIWNMDVNAARNIAYLG